MKYKETSDVFLEVSNSYKSAFSETVIEVALCDGRMEVLNVITDCISDEIANLLDDVAIHDEILTLSQGLQRGETSYSFEYTCAKTNHTLILKAVYADKLHESKYPVFHLHVHDVTILKNKFEKEKQNSAEFEQLTDMVSMGILKLSLEEDYPVLWCNGCFLKNTGYSDIHTNFTDYIAPEDRTLFDSMVEKSRNSEKIETFNLSIVNADGSKQVFEAQLIATNEAIRALDDYFYCTLSVLTTDKQKEQEFKNYEERYKMVLSFASEIVFEYDLHSDTIYYFGGEHSTINRPAKINDFLKKVYSNRLPAGKLSTESREEIRRIADLFQIDKKASADSYISYHLGGNKVQWVYIVAKCLFSEDNEAIIVVGKLTDVTVHKEVEQKLMIKANTDSLTRVSNRDYAQKEIEKYLEKHNPDMISALFIIDVDNFKNINDYYGHLQGDMVLTKLSTVLRDEFRGSDIIGRLGGDEFIVFIKDVMSPTVIYDKAADICRSVREKLNDVSVSVGVSIYNGDSNFEQLYRTADIALYQAKMRGKNTFSCYNDLSEDIKQLVANSNVGNGKIAITHIPGRDEFSTFDCDNFARSILDSYDYIYAANLTKDKMKRFNEGEYAGSEHNFRTYTEMFLHVYSEIFDVEEQTDFKRYFDRENLIAMFGEEDRFIHRYIRIFNTNQEFHWYFAEAILHENSEEGDVLCTIMFKDVQKSRSDEMRKIESRTKNNIIQKLEDEKSFDSLTGLYQSNKFYEVAKNRIWSGVGKKYAIISFDVDRFRVINDIYSEETGDQIICYIAEVLRRLEQEDKVFCRYYADCFTILVSYETRNDIIEIIDWIRHECGKTPYISTTFKMSFGVYIVIDPSIPIRLMCDWARLATRPIKGLSNQYYAFYNEEYRKELVETQKIEAEMHGALENEEFKMYLQPKYNLRTNEIVGAEALVRWQHPKEGILYPNRFIKLFEKNGFILQLDEYMWEQACKELRKWLDRGISYPISVNISRLHTYDPNLVQKLLHLVDKYDIPVHLLELEFTEGLLMENVHMLYGLMYDLKKNGFVLQMDDFGSGYSSLNMLKSVPIDVIKLDKVFFEDITENERGKIIIENSIEMIHNLKLEVMAEGIETIEHVNFLNKCNCVVGQGYYFAKPMPIEEFESKLLQ